jgi:hypothetical protein
LPLLQVDIADLINIGTTFNPNVAENSRGECLEDLHHPVLEVLASTKC